MVADQVRDYLLDGNVVNAVNFPNVAMPRESNFRIAIANANVPNMVGQISTAMAEAKLNIHNMMNKSQGRHGLHAGGCGQHGAEEGDRRDRRASRACWRCATCRSRG